MTSPTPGLDEAVEAALTEKREHPEEMLGLHQAVDAAYRARAEFFSADGLTYDEFMDPDGVWANDRDIIADAVGHAYKVIAAAVRAATLDEVQKIIEEEMSDPVFGSHDFMDGWIDGADAIACRVRALRTEGQ